MVCMVDGVYGCWCVWLLVCGWWCVWLVECTTIQNTNTHTQALGWEITPVVADFLPQYNRKKPTLAEKIFEPFKYNYEPPANTVCVCFAIVVLCCCVAAVYCAVVLLHNAVVVTFMVCGA